MCVVCCEGWWCVLRRVLCVLELHGVLCRRWCVSCCGGVGWHLRPLLFTCWGLANTRQWWLWGYFGEPVYMYINTLHIVLFPILLPKLYHQGRALLLGLCVLCTGSQAPPLNGSQWTMPLLISYPNTDCEDCWLGADNDVRVSLGFDWLLQPDKFNQILIRSCHSPFPQLHSPPLLSSPLPSPTTHLFWCQKIYTS